MSAVQIREACHDDVANLASVHLQTVVTSYAGLFPPWVPAPTYERLVEDWRTAFEDPTCKAFIAEDQQGAVGSVAVRKDPTAGCAQLRRLHVLPHRWNSGIGSALYDTSIDAMRREAYAEAALWVLAGNHRSRAFYERRGWRLVEDELLRWPDVGAVEVRYRLHLRR